MLTFVDVNECATHNGECAHNCTDLPVGRACWCRAGWRRAGRACRDVDECQEDRPCDHRCRYAPVAAVLALDRLCYLCLSIISDI